MIAGLIIALVLLVGVSVASADGGYDFHVVAPGETLTAIAKDWCTTVDTLVEMNNIADRNRIDVGQRLRVPSECGPGGVLPCTGEYLADFAWVPLDEIDIIYVYVDGQKRAAYIPSEGHSRRFTTGVELGQTQKVAFRVVFTEGTEKWGGTVLRFEECVYDYFVTVISHERVYVVRVDADYMYVY